MVAATTGHPAFAQYRAHRSGYATAIYPVNATDGAISFSTTAFAGGGENHLSFISGHDAYLLYDSTRRTRFSTTNDPVFTAGMVIVHDGKTVANRKCTGGASIRASAYTALPRVPFVARADH